VRAALARGEAFGAFGGGVVCFHNRLKWAQVMLLVVPAGHLTQEELWTGPALHDAAALAVRLGKEHCREDGFRLLSNFGRWAHQSQKHAHIHVISGVDRWLPKHGTPGPISPNIKDKLLGHFTAADAASQGELWSGRGITVAAADAIAVAKAGSPGGFRLVSNFHMGDEHTDGGPPGLFALGRKQLDLYM
jgi:diadenosine tetraphosphate (Ap4A) HIT family hydrolase